MGSIPEHPLILQALHDLKNYSQWVCYIFVSRGNKITKPPMNPNIDGAAPLKERMADVSNPATWSSYETAIARCKEIHSYKGVGFVFTANDPYCGVDLDNCVDPTTGKIAPWAVRLLKRLDSFSEFSARGTGLHILLRASLEETRKHIGLKDVQHKKGAIELYDQERYFTWSGRHIPGTPTTIEPRQDQLDELYFELFCIQDESEEQQPTLSPTHTTPAPQTPALMPDDQALIERAQTARGRNGRVFTQLWRGDLSGYSRPGSSEIDYSRADLALCSILAYWTNKDASRIDRLFRQSALYHIPGRAKKWNRPARAGETYGEGTIRVAIARCYTTYNPSWRPANWIDYSQTTDTLRKQSFPQNTEERRAQR